MGYTRNTKKNLLVAIESSVESDLFRRLYVWNDAGEEVEVLENGMLSCAYFVTSLLTLAGRMDQPHATVATALKLLENSPKWSIVTTPEAGDVTYWPAGAHGHTHLGFYLGEDEVVSTSARLGVPIRHELRMEDGREPAAYWHYQDDVPA